MRSPSHPHMNDPSTVPVIPESAISAAGNVPPGFSGDFNPYSAVIPGMTNASAVGFMMSMVTAMAMTTSRPMWVRVMGASSSALTRMPEAASAAAPPERGYRPYRLAASPTMIAAMPHIMGASIGIPTSR